MKVIKWYEILKKQMFVFDQLSQIWKYVLYNKDGYYTATCAVYECKVRVVQYQKHIGPIVQS